MTETPKVSNSLIVRAPKQKEGSSGSGSRRSSGINYAESSDDLRSEQEEPPPPVKKSKKSRKKHDSDDSSSSDAKPKLKRTKTRPSAIPKSLLKRPGLSTSNSMPELRRASSSNGSISTNNHALTLDALTPEESKKLLDCPSWSLLKLEKVVWTFIEIQPEEQPSTSANSVVNERCGIWWPAEVGYSCLGVYDLEFLIQNTSYDEDMETTIEPLHLQLIPDSSMEIFQHAYVFRILLAPSQLAV